MPGIFQPILKKLSINEFTAQWKFSKFFRGKKKKNWILGLRIKFWLHFWNLRLNRVRDFFFVTFADSAYSARYCASKFFRNAKNLKKNSQKKSLGEEIWGKRNRHQIENKKWCLGFFNRFFKNWVWTNL